MSRVLRERWALLPICGWQGIKLEGRKPKLESVRNDGFNLGHGISTVRDLCALSVVVTCPTVRSRLCRVSGETRRAIEGRRLAAGAVK